MQDVPREYHREYVPGAARRTARTNPLDRVADNVAQWADDLSTAMAEAIKGGLSAPGAAQLSEQAKFEYYTRQFFEPDGSPNMLGRAQEMARLGPEGFEQVLREILAVFPDWKQPAEPWSAVASYTPPGADEPTYTNPDATEVT